MKTECPHCRHEYDLPETFKGQKVKCIKCGEVFVIKEPVKKNSTATAASSPSKRGCTSAKINKMSHMRKKRCFECSLLSSLRSCCK